MPERRHSIRKKDLLKLGEKINELGHRAIKISDGSKPYLCVNKGHGASDDACCYPRTVEIYTEDQKLLRFLRKEYWIPF